MKRLIGVCLIAMLGLFPSIAFAAAPAPAVVAAPQKMGTPSVAACLQVCFNQQIKNNNACDDSCYRCTAHFLFWCIAGTVDEGCYGTCIANAQAVYNACAAGCDDLPTP